MAGKHLLFVDADNIWTIGSKGTKAITSWSEPAKRTHARLGTAVAFSSPYLYCLLEGRLVGDDVSPPRFFFRYNLRSHKSKTAKLAFSIYPNRLSRGPNGTLLLVGGNSLRVLNPNGTVLRTYHIPPFYQVDYRFGSGILLSNEDSDTPKIMLISSNFKERKYVGRGEVAKWDYRGRIIIVRTSTELDVMSPTTYKRRCLFWRSGGGNAREGGVLVMNKTRRFAAFIYTSYGLMDGGTNGLACIDLKTNKFVNMSSHTSITQVTW